MHIHRLLNPAVWHDQVDAKGISSSQSWALAIGNFDGVHQGHQLIIKTLKEQASRVQAQPAVMIFESQPLEYFLKDKAPIRLMSARDKIQALFNEGVAMVLVCRFDQELSLLHPADFMKNLRENVNIKGLTLGQDFRFGFKRLGDVAYLKGYCQNEALDLVAMPDFNLSQTRVSSSLIRQFIGHSQFDEASLSLGRPYYLEGVVQHGRKLARDLGFPTANVKVVRRIPPLHGVFVGKAYLPYNGEVHYNAVANCGWKPSVGGRVWQVEVHIFDENFKPISLYGQRLRFEPMAKLRDEQKFDSLEALKNAIAQDVKAARAFMNTESC